MVWGLVSPISFGPTFPDSKDYVGWEKQLRDYYDHEMTEAEKIAMGMTKNMGFAVGAFSRKFDAEGEPLKPHECPAEIQLSKTYHSLGSLIELDSRLLAVDEKLKAIIESFEPDVHQFWPIKITMPRGKEYPAPYFAMVIRQHIDSFLPNHSSKFRLRPSSMYYFVESGPGTREKFGKLTFSKDKINSMHLWRERLLLDPNILMSDELQAEIARQGLHIFKHYPMKAV